MSSILRQLSAGEFSGDKSELHRPTKLLLRACIAIIVIIILLLAVTVLVGQSAGPFVLAIIFLSCINFNNMQLRRGLKRPQIKSVLLLAIALGFFLSFFATLYPRYWPARMFEYKGTMYLTTNSWQEEIPDFFFWLRYVLIIICIAFEYPLFIYLGRVITEIRYPNLPNSIRAKTGYIKSGAIGDTIKYENPDVVDFANEVLDSNPVDDDVADWLPE